MNGFLGLSIVFNMFSALLGDFQAWLVPPSLVQALALTAQPLRFRLSKRLHKVGIFGVHEFAPVSGCEA
jgi:hypothetical protein